MIVNAIHFTLRASTTTHRIFDWQTLFENGLKMWRVVGYTVFGQMFGSTLAAAVVLKSVRLSTCICILDKFLATCTLVSAQKNVYIAKQSHNFLSFCFRFCVFVFRS